MNFKFNKGNKVNINNDYKVHQVIRRDKSSLGHNIYLMGETGRTWYYEETLTLFKEFNRNGANAS